MELSALSAWPGVGIVRPLRGGARNSVWLAEGPGGPVVVKTTRRSAAAIAWVDRLQAVAGGLGLASPRLCPAADGRLTAGGLTVEPFVPGQDGDAAALLTLRRGIASLHDATRDWPQRPGFVTAAEVVDSGLMPPDLPEDAAHFVRATLAALDIGGRAAIHGDLNSANVIVPEAGPPALIDWDEARVDHPGLDLSALAAETASSEGRARLALEIVTGWSLEPAHATSLIDRCRADGTFANVF